jgi:hypothetical protein
VRRQLLNAGNDLPGIVESLRKVEMIAGYENSVIAPIIQRLKASDGKAELIEEVVAAISNKEARQLNQEDYGRASGVLEVLQSLTPPQGRMTVTLPDGARRELPAFAHEHACLQICEAVRAWEATYSLSPEQTAALVLGVLFPNSAPSGGTVEVASHPPPAAPTP